MTDDPTIVSSGAGGEDRSSTLKAGDRLGDYRIIGLLGSGAMGEVYEAEHGKLGRRCALKVLPPQLSADESFRERFGLEARTLAAMDHSNIVSIHDAGEAEGHFFLVMELLAPLGTVQGTQSLVRVLTDILKALAYAHDLGILHRDLKPANLLQGADGQLKIADFGVARVLGSDFLQTVVEETVARTRMGDAATLLSSGSGRGSSNYVGTLQYMAPEVIEGGEADPRSDLYAVGVMAYEWLTGHKPVGRYRNASEWVPGLHKSWDDWLNQLLASEPERRFQSAEAALDALPGHRQPASGGRRWLGGALLVALLLGTGAFAYFLGSGEHEGNGIDGTHGIDERNGSYKADPAEVEPEPVVPSLQRGELEPERDPQPPVEPDPAAEVEPEPVVPSLQRGDPEPQPTPEPEPSSDSMPAVDSEITPEPEDIPAASTPRRGQEYALDLGNGEAIEFVWLASFEKWVGRYAVTNAEYRRYAPEHDSGTYQGNSLDGDLQPVVQVSYEDAQDFITRLNIALEGTGTQVRLPRLDEARALARTGEDRTYLWGDDLPPAYGNYADRETVTAFSWRRLDSDFNHRNRYDDGFRVTAPVDESGRNDFGLYGIGGNVWEWTEDLQNGEPIATGASWRTRDPVAMLVTSTRREAAGRRSGFDDIGFRLVLEYVR